MGSSALAKLVDVAGKAAVQLLLNGTPAFNRPGMLATYNKLITDPTKKLIEREGIKMTESSRSLKHRSKETNRPGPKECSAQCCLWIE